MLADSTSWADAMPSILQAVSSSGQQGQRIAVAIGQTGIGQPQSQPRSQTLGESNYGLKILGAAVIVVLGVWAFKKFKKS